MNAQMCIYLSILCVGMQNKKKNKETNIYGMLKKKSWRLYFIFNFIIHG